MKIKEKNGTKLVFLPPPKTSWNPGLEKERGEPNMNPWNARGEMRFYLLLLATGEIRLAPGQFAANQALEIIKDRDFSL